LFIGKASFDVAAGGDLLLGPIANPFLLPEGINNSYWYKTYFSTYAANSGVTVESLTGNVTLREDATPHQTRQPVLQAWLEWISRFDPQPAIGRQHASWVQPWLRLDETSVNAFGTVASLLPPSVRATAFSGDLNVQGDLTLSPASHG